MVKEKAVQDRIHEHTINMTLEELYSWLSLVDAITHDKFKPDGETCVMVNVELESRQKIIFDRLKNIERMV